MDTLDVEAVIQRLRVINVSIFASVGHLVANVVSFVV